MIIREERLVSIGILPLTVAAGPLVKLTSNGDGANITVDIRDVTNQGNEPTKLATHALDI